MLMMVEAELHGSMMASTASHRMSFLEAGVIAFACGRQGMCARVL